MYRRKGSTELEEESAEPKQFYRDSCVLRIGGLLRLFGGMAKGGSRSCSPGSMRCSAHERVAVGQASRFEQRVSTDQCIGTLDGVPRVWKHQQHRQGKKRPLSPEISGSWLEDGPCLMVLCSHSGLLRPRWLIESNPGGTWVEGSTSRRKLAVGDGCGKTWAYLCENVRMCMLY